MIPIIKLDQIELFIMAVIFLQTSALKFYLDSRDNPMDLNNESRPDWSCYGPGNMLQDYITGGADSTIYLIDTLEWRHDELARWRLKSPASRLFV